MHHQIAGGQVGEGVELLPVGGAGLLGSLPFRFAAGNELTLCQHRQTAHGVFHAIGQGALGEQNLPRLGQGGQGNADEGGQIFAAQHLLQNFRPPPGAAEHQRAEFLLLIVGQV